MSEEITNKEVKETNVLSTESAEAILNKFLERLRIKIEDLPDSEQKTLIKNSKANLVKEIRTRRVEIDEKNGFKVILQTMGGSKITFNLPGARAKRAMGDKLTTDLYGRIYSMMGACCEEGEAIIDKLDITDLSVVETFGAIFLSV